MAFFHAKSMRTWFNETLIANFALKWLLFLINRNMSLRIYFDETFIANFAS